MAEGEADVATIYDLFEVTGISAYTTYSTANGNLLGVVDGAVSSELDDGEFDERDLITIEGVVYSIDEIEEPSSAGSFLLGDGSSRGFQARSESNLDVMFLTVSNGSSTRYFILPNDAYGDMKVQAIITGAINGAAGSDAAVIGTVDNATEVVCFAAGSLIEGDAGRMAAVETLRPGDLVRTVDHGLQRLRWVGLRRLRPAELAANPKLRPIRIRAGTFGDGAPFRDLVVSPQHRILIRSKVAERMFGSHEVLMSARLLLAVDGVELAEDLRSVTYCHLLFDRHEVVFANGLRAESLLAGPMALKALGAEAREELFALFPDLAKADQTPDAARALAVGHRARRLLVRHRKNDRPLNLGAGRPFAGAQAARSAPGV